VEWSIADVIAGFLAEIGDRLVFADEVASVDEQTIEPPQNSQTAAASEENEDRQPQGGVEEATTTVNNADGPPAVTRQPYLDDASTHFEILIGLAPFVLIGQTSDYARIGWNTDLSVGYRFVGEQTQIVLAFSTGLCSFTAESAASRSRVVLTPLAARISLRTSPSRLGFLLHLGGGPAVFMVSPNQSAFQFKLVPYATSGIGVDFPISGYLGVLIDLSFSVYFESSQPVMGYAPSVNVHYRF
jgi:hypothetical protein